MTHKIHFCAAFVLLFFFIFVSQSIAQPDTTMSRPEFDQDSENIIHAGYIRLSWHIPEDAPEEHPTFELQQAQSPDFSDASTRYKGPDRASYISGLPDGDFYFRVREVQNDRTGPWSEPILVGVEHHSRELAYLLFALGSIVFLATVAVVLVGQHRAKTEDI